MNNLSKDDIAILKEILLEIKELRNDISANTNNSDINKFVIEVAKDNATFMKNVPGLSGAKNEAYKCDSNMNFGSSNVGKEKKHYTKTKFTVIISTLITVFLLVGRNILNLLKHTKVI